MSTSFKNCTHVVKTRLLEGSMSYVAQIKRAVDALDLTPFKE